MKTQVTVLEDGRLEGYLSTEEYSKKHGVPYVTVKLWIREGRIDGIIKIYGRYYIPCESVVPEKRKTGRKKGKQE